VLAAADPRSSDMRHWLSVLDEATGIRRLLAVVAFGSPPAVRAAQRWWRDSVKGVVDDVTAAPDAVNDLSVLTALMDKSVRPLPEAASVLLQAFDQVRDLTRVLQHEETRRTQFLDRHAAEATKNYELIVRELARLRSWAGEQQASVRNAVGDLTAALRALEARMDRVEGSARDIPSRMGAAGAALERGQTTTARRQLAHLRAGVRKVGIFADAMNLSVSAREAHDCGVRYGALRDRGRELGEVAIARAYVVEHPAPDRQAGFETAFRRSGFEVRTPATSAILRWPVES
jgi:NYN domain